MHGSTSQRRTTHIDPSVFTSMADRCAIGLLMAASSFSEKAYLCTALIIIRLTRLFIIGLFGLFGLFGLGTRTVGAGRVDAGGEEFQ
jgi:hypothetical protein